MVAWVIGRRRPSGSGLLPGSVLRWVGRSGLLVTAGGRVAALGRWRGVTALGRWRGVTALRRRRGVTALGGRVGVTTLLRIALLLIALLGVVLLRVAALLAVADLLHCRAGGLPAGRDRRAVLRRLRRGLHDAEDEHDDAADAG